MLSSILGLLYFTERELKYDFASLDSFIEEEKNIVMLKKIMTIAKIKIIREKIFNWSFFIIAFRLYILCHDKLLQIYQNL